MQAACTALRANGFSVGDALILGATMRTLRIAWVGALLLLVAGSVSAHHSFAMFDRSKETTIVGVVEDFQWTNPHSWIELDVPNESGGADKWSIELNSPNNLSRQGWKSTSVKPGDKISVIIWPLRSGEKGGLFISLTLPNGQILDEMAFRKRNNNFAIRSSDMRSLAAPRSI